MRMNDYEMKHVGETHFYIWYETSNVNSFFITCPSSEMLHNTIFVLENYGMTLKIQY